MTDTRIAFLGTPAAAVPTLDALAVTSEIAGVVTQPDRPRGRSKKLMPSPVKIRALELGLSVAQPEGGTGLREALRQFGRLDVGVVVAYGRILRSEALAIPRHGMVNVHFSLLPRWRGAAPVNRALMAGDSMTGVTIIGLDEGLDTGRVINAQAIDILPFENAGDLTERLALLGANLLVKTMEPFLKGDLDPIPQSDEGVTYAHKLDPADRPIELGSASVDVVNQVRALAPKPAATLTIDGDTHKILKARVGDSDVDLGGWEEQDGWPVFGVEDGSVRIELIQPPGRNVMSGEDWLRGRRSRSGGVD